MHYTSIPIPYRLHCFVAETYRQLLQCADRLQQLLPPMRRLIDIHQEEERQLVIRVLLPHLQTGRLRLEHLPAMNQRADLLRMVRSISI